MSALNWARQFAENSYPSILICKQDSPLHRQAQQLPEIASVGVASRRIYFDPTTSLQIRKCVLNSSVRALFLHHLKDIWTVSPALWKLDQVQCFGFARMFLKDVNKKDYLHKKLYQRFSNLIALTETQKQSLLNCLPLPEEKYQVIPNAVNTGYFKPGPKQDFRASKNIPENAVLIGFLGRLDLQKGVSEFLTAAERIVKDRPEAYFIIMGGETLGEGHFSQQIIDKVHSLSTDQIQWVPPSKDVLTYLQALDIFVMPSYEEAFGKVLIEAMACGAACISTRAGGVPDILTSSKDGLLIEPKSSSAIHEAVVRLIEDPNERLRLSKAARETAVANFDHKKVFEKVAHLIM